jgi:hypothetical protein
VRRAEGLGAVPLVLGVCALALVGGFALKAQCLTDWSGYVQYERLCYNDIQPLYAARGIATDTFPYVHGSLQGSELSGGAIEYPVLTGLFMWGTGLLVSNVDQYLIVSAILLAPAALVVAHLLARMEGRRALMWAASPALVLYAFHNWDLLVVAAATAGFFAHRHGRATLAAALFGVGGALKAYPLLFLPALALQSWFAGRRKEAAGVIGVGAGTFALVNLPFALANSSGWWATFRFHSERGPNFDNIWAIRDFGPLSLPRLEPAELNLVTFGLTGAFIAVALMVGALRARPRPDQRSLPSVRMSTGGSRAGALKARGWGGRGGYPFVPVAAACLAAFLLWNKVHSPQYALWILPLFVLLEVHWGWWAAYSVADLAAYVGVFRFFFDACSGGTGCSVPADPTLAQRLMGFGVFGRAGLLLALFVVFLRAAPSGARYDVRTLSPGGVP